MNNIHKKLLVYFSILFFVLLFTSSCNKNSKVTKSSFAFDTIITISIYDSSIKNNKKADLIDNAIRMCNELDDKYSSTKKYSEVYLYNHSDNSLSEDVSDLLDKTKYFYDLSGGLFDCFIGALIELWNNKERNGLPSETEILNAKNLNKKYLNFGAVIKGYACDKIKTYFQKEGVKSALINLGGNVLCIGSKDTSEGFDIGIEKPFSQNEVIKVLNVNDRSVVTSGIYQRYFKVSGSDRIYHHIINPFTGYPVDNNLYSVTVVSNSSLLGDMLSTTILLMNPNASEMLDIIKKVNHDYGDDVSIILVDDKYKVIEINANSAL